MDAREETVHFNLNEQCKGERSRHGANSSHAGDATASTLGGVALVLDDRSAPSSRASAKLVETLCGMTCPFFFNLLV